jgi:hypothetical protein
MRTVQRIGRISKCAYKADRLTIVYMAVPPRLFFFVFSPQLISDG